MRGIRRAFVPQVAQVDGSREAGARQANAAQQEQRSRELLERSPLDGAIVLDTEDDGRTTGIPFQAATPKIVTHGLGRRPRFVVVLSAWEGYPNFYRIDQSDELDAQTVKLSFQATCRVILAIGGT